VDVQVRAQPPGSAVVGPDGGPSDLELVERVLRGDREAFRRLYLRHARYLAGVVVRVLGDDADLDDIVQETFVRAADHLVDLRERSVLRPWLAAIAVRQCQARLELRRRRGALTRQWGHGLPHASDPAARAPADDLYAALEQVPDACRIPWVLHHVEGEKLEDTARICSVSLATVKRRITEAHARLTKILGATPCPR
jgi:RNA polymerase sigma-70 factor, ECF subfamily